MFTAAVLMAAGPVAGATDAPASPSDPDPAFHATVTTVPEDYRDLMIGVSWKPGCPVPIDDLRIIEMNHWGFDGTVHEGGRLMVHREVVDEVVAAFGDMFAAGFPIRRMELIEEYDGSDDASMAADNTSAFNCRPITGSPGRFSIHSYGKAIDINTVENPYVNGDTVLPPAGAEYLDRDDVRPGMIVKNDAVVKAFKKRGFEWGGNWHSLKDYQHMEAKQV
ncbi:M15 family metallopeptidase [Nocardioides sp.]|uniref:M15 family metallopeptidase n=1 Tax=Nocardioides sp. TaxID=35761 RepID=UPI002ED1A0B5